MSIAEPVARIIAADEKEALPKDPQPRAQQQAAADALLKCFVATRDERAFEQLVSRHASLVMGVCRRALGNLQDAEDAFQATFLVLARKAASVRRAKSLPAWLHQTAFRIALRARARRARRREQPFEIETMTTTEAFSQIANEHERSVLDEELNRLPEKYRLPLFLCCLEGKSREEAAAQIGLSAGAIKGRLERGRNLLRRRLMLRGVSLSIAIGLMAGLQQSAQASQVVAPALIASTVQAGVQYAAGQSTLGLVSQTALSLANGTFQIMSLTTTKLVACCLMLVGALAVASNWMPAPAIAGGDGNSFVLPQQPSSHANAENFVAFLAGDEDGPRRSAEGDAGPRRSAEGDAGPRRSAEGDAGPRRSAEGDAGPRRSAEGDAGPRRSAEGDAGPRRSAEGDRGPRDGAEGDGSRRAADALKGFKPQSQREAALYQMILQLQREVAAMRREMQNQRGARDGDAPRTGPRDGDAPRTGPRDGERARESGPRDGDSQPLSAAWEKTKGGSVFKAYDKNNDLYVSLDEWLAMTNGNVSDARRQVQTERFREMKPGTDGKLSPAEFIDWWNSREGAIRSRRDGESGRSAEGDGQRRSPEADAGTTTSPEGESRRDPRER